MDKKEKPKSSSKKSPKSSSDKPTDQVLLTEYNDSQKFVKQHQTQYWTIFSIFIGISTAAITWIISNTSNETSVLINGNLFFIGHHINGNLSVLGQAVNTNTNVVITALGISFILVIYIFKLWIKRVAYTEKHYFIRMREIELDLNMWQGWRIHILDEWNKYRKQKNSYTISEISGNYWVVFRNILQKGLSSSHYCTKLDVKKDQVIQIIMSNDQQQWYEKSFHKLHYSLFTNILISLWFFLIVWSSGWLSWSLLILVLFICPILLVFLPGWEKRSPFKQLKFIGFI